MRMLFLILSLIASFSAFSISCPNNGKILQVGDSMEEVLNSCGKPVQFKNYITSVNVASEWIYLISNLQNNSTREITVKFLYNKISNIYAAPVSSSLGVVYANNTPNIPTALGKNIASFNDCKALIQLGDTMQYIRTICGVPSSEKIIETKSTEITEFRYNTDNINTLVLEDGKLSDWK